MDFPELLKVIFLGAVEGVTEWLPISSTGHMLLIDALVPLNMSESFKEMFMVVIQFGAIIAVVTMFWDRVFPFQFKKRPAIKKDVISLWGKIVVSCVPTGILGILFDDFLEQYFGTAQTIAIMLIVYGLAFIVVETWNKKRTPAVNSTKEISYNTAVLFGVFQALAMIPGTSRSGSTIIGALLIGVSRATAAEFSFFLAIPTILGASVFKLIKFGFSFSTVELQALLIGMTVAFAVSLLVLKLIMKYIQKHDFKIFGWYRIILGIVVLILFKTKV